MRKFGILFGFISIIFFSQCFGPKKFTYSFPTDITEAKLKESNEKCEAGYKLYKVYCASCHKVKSKTGIPTFTKGQITSYSLKTGSDPKAKHEIMKNISQEDFQKIIFFLYYLDNK